MALTYRMRRKLCLGILCIGLPAYIVLIWAMTPLIAALPVWGQALIYCSTGVAWAFPLKFIFKGIGKPDPNE